MNHQQPAAATQPSASVEQPAATDHFVGILQSSYTVSLTFSARPNDEMRRKLKASGFLFDRGRWYRNQSDSQNATLAMIEKLLEA